MSCLNSLQLFYDEETQDRFFPSHTELHMDHPGYDLIDVPCGKCLFCYARRARDWSVRAICQNKMSDSSYFLTLTYDPEKWGHYKGLNFDHLREFWDRLRSNFYYHNGYRSGLSYLACGEYGGQRGHPHYHALIYNHPLEVQWLDESKQRGISKTLERDWPWGFHSIGQVTSKSARYLANYTLKKSVSKDEDSRKLVCQTTGKIVCRPPESIRVSRGFSLSFYKKYFSDIYPSDSFRLEKDGPSCRPPAYFDKKLKEDHPVMYEQVKRKRREKLETLLERQKDVSLEARKSNFLARFKNFRPLESKNLNQNTFPGYIPYDKDYQWKMIFGDQYTCET